ncbi:MAG: SMP-30/gluconolactonase/LRE family protein [Leptolinea sp.]
MKLKNIFVVLIVLMGIGLIFSTYLDSGVVLAKEGSVETPLTEPAVETTLVATQEPLVEPTSAPTQEPTVEPTQESTVVPTQEPTVVPTQVPTVEPTQEPTGIPTQVPTVEPTQEPAGVPTQEPLNGSTDNTDAPILGGYSAPPPESGPLPRGLKSLQSEPPSLASSLASWGAIDMDSSGKLNQPNGVAVDSTGNVYVADTQNRRIKKYNSSGSFILQWGEWSWEDWNFQHPIGIAVDKARGWVYVADEWANSIKKFDLDGNYQNSLGGYGSEDGAFNGVGGVAVNQNTGDVYGTDLNNQRIQKFDSSGTYLTQWGPSIASPGVNFEWIYGVAVDSSGNVYVTDQGTNAVQKFTAAGVPLAKLYKDCSDDNGWVCGPYGIAVDSANNVYISDELQRVQKFSSSFVYMGKLGTPGFAAGQLNHPRGLAVDNSGNIYVADQYNHRIQKFNAAYTYLGSWGSSVTANGQLNESEGIALSPDGISVYVADTRNHRLQKFNASGGYVTKWGSQGYGYRHEEPFKYTNLADVAVDASGDVYVLDQWDNRIIKTDPDGGYQTYFGGDWGDLDGQLRDPSSIALDTGGNLYIADRGNSRIQKFDISGGYVTQWGSPGSGNSQFQYNLDIAVDRTNNWVYVADTENNRIQKFDLDGVFQTKWGSQGEGANQFQQPSGVDVDSSGRVYVTDRWNGVVKVFNSDGGFLGTWGSWGSDSGQFIEPMDIAVDLYDNVYVVDKGGGYRVQKFEPFFKTSTPSTPTLISPNGSTSSYVPSYKWNVSSGATRYGLKIDGGTEKIYSMYPYCNAAVCEVWFLGPLSLGAHTFQVKAGDASTWSDWSSTMSFIILENGPASLKALWGWADSGSGKNMRWPFDIAVDRTNNVLYVADAMLRNIYKYDLAGNLLLTFGDCCGGPGRFSFPRALTVDKDHNLLVTDSNNGRIVKFDPNGVFLATFGYWGSGEGQFIVPGGIAVDAIGNIYVSDSDNHRVQKFDESGSFLKEWGIQGSGDGEFNFPAGIAVDSTSVYVADSENDRVQKFDQDGGYIGQWGSFGSGHSQFKQTSTVEVDLDGNILVGDYWGQRIQKFNSSGVYMSQWGAPGRDDGQFNPPQGIAVDSSGNVYVADTWNSRIQKFSSAYAYVSQWGTDLTPHGLLNIPRGILLNSTGDKVYVADERNHRVQQFNASGVYQSSFGSPGFGDGEINTVRDLVMDSSGNLFVVDVGNHRIQKFNGSGSYLDQWGDYGSASSQFKYPLGIGIDGSDNLYIADSENHRIQKFGNNGIFITEWGSEGSADDQFKFPQDIAVDSNGYVYVTDAENHRIQKFDKDGNFIKKWGTEGSANGQFGFPVGITIDQNNAVWVADSWNNRVQVFSPDGTYLNKLDNGCCANAGNLANPLGLAISQGYLYVSDVNNRIQKFSAPSNHAPTQIALSNSLVTHNSAEDTQIGTFTSTNENAHDTFTYDLVTDVSKCGGDGGAEGNAFFKMGTGANADKLLVDTPPTPGDKNICVRSTDASELIYTKAITITVVYSLSGTVTFPACGTLKLGGGLIANFGAKTGMVDFVTGDYTIANVVNGATGTVMITQPSDGYTITNTSGGTIEDPPGIVASRTGINFTTVGNRSISGTFTGPVDHGDASRVPDDRAGTASVTLANCVEFHVPTGDQPTTFTISGLPPKAFILTPTYGKGALASNPIFAFSASQYANTIYSNVIGKAFTFTWTPFVIGGSAKNNFGINLTGTSTVTLVGTAPFVGINGTGSAGTTGTWTSSSTFRKPVSGINDPQPYQANITFANTNYQDFVLGTSGIQTFNSTKTNNVTAYGSAAIYGPFGGYTVPAGTVVNFGTGLNSNIEDAGQFLLSNLEPKSYTLVPTAAGIYFTNSATVFAQASQPIPAIAAGTDATGKFYAWSVPKPLTPATTVAFDNAARPTFTWEAASGATDYDLQISTVSTFATTVYSKVGTGNVTSYTIDADIVPNTTYWWRVRATGGTWSSQFPAYARSFMTKYNAPTIGTFVWAGTGTATATLTWTDSVGTLPAGSKYKVEYSKISTFASGVTSAFVAKAVQTYTTTATAANVPTVSYYYRVTLVNAAGTTSLSAASATGTSTTKH